MKNVRFLTAALVAGVLSVAACDSLLDQTNPNELSTETFYRTGPQAQAAVNAVYASLQTRGLYLRQMYFSHDLLSGEARGLGSLQGELRDYDNPPALDPSNIGVQFMWESHYRGIHRANLVIENVPNTTEQITEEQRQRFIAEARFLRAWHYFQLVSKWGEVPLLDEVADQEDIEGVPLASTDAIYELILSDLAFAEDNLPPKSAYDGNNLGRAPREAATALRGQLYLFREDYAAAAEAFRAVMSSGEYQLVEEYFDNFREETENNVESLFEVQFAPIQGGGLWAFDAPGASEVTFRGQEYGFKAWRNVVPSQRLLDEYESGDPRYAANFYSPCDLYNNGLNTIYTPQACPPPQGENATVPDDLPSWRKYQNYYRMDNEPFAASPLNFRVIRYAQVLIDLAEAEAELGNLGRAVELLNMVRARPSVNMPPYPTAEYPTGTREEVLDAIYHERAVEFAGEQVLYPALIRRPDYFQQWKPSVQLPKHLRLPIPQAEIDNNNALTNEDQNPGY